MKRFLQLLARGITVAGLCATGAYLGWRVVGSLGGSPLWLSVPFLVVELTGLFAAAFLTWALWPQPVTDPDGPLHGPMSDPVDVIVRVIAEQPHEVRATLLACSTLPGVASVAVVDIGARPEIAALATEFGTLYAATDPDDHNGLLVAAAMASTPTFALLDGGDIPALDFVSRLARGFDRPDVAIVQGLRCGPEDDSSKRTAEGYDEMAFEHSVLNPALGQRGAAMWLGSGSLVQRDALRSVGIGQRSTIEEQLRIGAVWLSQGHRIVSAAGAPAFTTRALQTSSEAYSSRAQRAHAMRGIVFGRGGAMRGRGMPASTRAALVAWAVRPLSGMRRLLFVAVLMATLLAGQLPMRPAVTPILLWWLPGLVLTALGLTLLSGGVLLPGDRARVSMQMIGPALGVRRNKALVGLVVVVSAAVALRGISDRFTHSLPALPQRWLLGLLAVGLWTLAVALDGLRLLARPDQLRRAPRMVSSLPAALDGRPVFIVDLTALGAGVVADHTAERGESVQLEAVLPTASGITTVEMPATVRNMRHEPSGGWRLGVEFGEHAPATANALAELCTIEPARVALGETAPKPTEAPVFAAESVTIGGRRMALRFTGLIAIAGVVASAAPTQVSAAGVARLHVRGTVVQVVVADPSEPPIDTAVSDSLVDHDEAITTTTAAVVASSADTGIGGAEVVGVCSIAAGADGLYGTNDDTYTAPVSTMSAANGSYELDVTGSACWVSIAPPQGYQPAPTTFGKPATAAGTPRVVSLGAGGGHMGPVVLAPISPNADEGSSSASLGDRVWADANANGVQDAGEAGVPAVTITLFDATGAALHSALTDASGEFHFDHLAAGSYTIGASNVPAGLVLTSPALGTDRGLDSDADAVTGRTAPVALEDGQQTAAIDIGLRPAAAGAPAPVEAGRVRLLPAPRVADLAGASHRSNRPLMVALLFAAAVLGGSLLIGSVRPRRSR